MIVPLLRDLAHRKLAINDRAMNLLRVVADCREILTSEGLLRLPHDGFGSSEILGILRPTAAMHNAIASLEMHSGAKISP